MPRGRRRGGRGRGRNKGGCKFGGPGYGRGGGRGRGRGRLGQEVTMPKDFENCIARGGRVRRKKIKGGYINICFINGKSYAGHKHTTKGKK